MKTAIIQNETKGEIIANSVSHGIGALLGISGLSILVSLSASSGDILRIVSFSIYGSSLVLLYLASTLYHSLSTTRARNVFMILDHSCIFILIAGTYTPFTLISLRESVGWIFFGVIWGLAILGIIFKSIFIHHMKILSYIIYVVMGWLIIFALKPLLNTLSTEGFVLLTIGGACYTIGLVFFALKKLKFNHAIWHLFVLAGSACHFFTLLFYVL